MQETQALFYPTFLIHYSSCAEGDKNSYGNENTNGACKRGNSREERDHKYDGRNGELPVLADVNYAEASEQSGKNVVKGGLERGRIENGRNKSEKAYAECDNYGRNDRGSCDSDGGDDFSLFASGLHLCVFHGAECARCL